MRKQQIQKTNNDSDADQKTVMQSRRATELAKIKSATRRQILLAVGALLAIVVLVVAMTSAWYTNVSKVNSLKFKTEAWGFDAEKITVDNDDISIAPGMSGIIPMSIDNSDKSEKVKISVSVSKEEMDAELQKRIYFYADGTKVINSETVSRQYLSSINDNHYEYLLLQGEQLILNDDYYSDIPIKWQWVYDMVGYYFSGTVNEETIVYDGFIRPIEYDLDKAVFDIEGEGTTGKLLSVDGVPAENLMYAISASDGFEGTIDINNTVVIGSSVYYPIDVNFNGEGIWAYLCSYKEIQDGMIFDTNMSAQSYEISATLSISAVSLPYTSEKVSSEDSLRNVLTETDIDVIELTEDIELSSVLLISSEKDLTLNLNGFSINYTGSESSYNMFQTINGASLTVINGEITGNGGLSTSEGAINSIAFNSACGNLALSNVKVTGFDSSVYIADINGNGETDSVVRITNCELDAKGPAVFIMGNGSATDESTKLIINESVINSAYVGICGQGSPNKWGTEISILNSKVTGKYAALYQPQQKGSTLIKDSEMSGITGIAVKGGTVTVTDSKISGTGDYTPAKSSNSGWTDTGDGIYIEADYNWNASVYIKGNSVITSENAYAVEIFGKQGAGVGRVLIYDGEFTAERGSAFWNSIGTFRIYGGTFNNSVSEDIDRFNLG